MKIKEIKLKNYKFHHKLKFNIENNSLIYGENGTGKSSIYKALYSNFYYLKDNKIVTNQIDIREKFIHRDYSNENLEVNIDFNNEIFLNRKNNILDNSEILEKQTIYFADEKVLHKIVQNNFYEVIDSELVKHFLELNRLNKLYNKIPTLMSRKTEQEELIKARKEVDYQYKKLFNELIPIHEINRIINKEFCEDFEIEFDIKDSDIEFDNQKFIPPIISIRVKNIDDKGDFKNHFNEAKLKLIALSIYFALAKKYETDSELKLLVLDDFLTSLDMANRKLIIQYILDNFGEYQKIILTHNLQFSNLIIELLKMREEDIYWDMKNLFFRRINGSYETLIYDKETDYIKLSDEYLNENLLDEAGIYLRKEFERILDELRQKNEIGAKEKLGNIKSQLLELNSSDDINIKKMQEILKKTKFYQDTVLHSTAHYDSGTPIYRKELNGAKVLLEQLRKQLRVLKV
jgi:energy-coupling factor transporter ATP-binding protein EcfA2